MPVETTTTTDQSNETDLASALQQYLQTVSKDKKQAAQGELAKFMRWIGGDRHIGSLAPPEIGEYSEFVSAGGTAPAAMERLAIVKQFLAYLKKKGIIETSLAQHLRLRKGRTNPERAKLSRENFFHILFFSL